MSGHTGSIVVHLAIGVAISILGAIVIRYPQASYAIRTAWKHDDVSLTDRGRTDQRLMGAIIVLIGLGVFIRGLSFL